MTAESLADRRDEFKSHVWNHAEDPFQLGFDARARLDDRELELVKRLLAAVRHPEREDVAEALTEALSDRPEDIYVVLQLVGLTRNKILTDLKAGLSASDIKVPTSPQLLPSRPEAWTAAAAYLEKRLRTVFAPLAPAHGEALEGALEALNQATWPGWIRQERAKRQGHEAEHRLAVLFESLGFPFEPEEKADNPLCADAQIDGISYDLVSPGVSAPLLAFKATVHTANIGQYGESKDALEVSEAKSTIAASGVDALLMALVDGIGFFTNRAGLEGVLEGADEFCQFKTLWKAAVVGAKVNSRAVDLVLADPDRHQPFLDRYSDHVRLLEEPSDLPGWVEAGEASVRTAG